MEKLIAIFVISLVGLILVIKSGVRRVSNMNHGHDENTVSPMEGRFGPFLGKIKATGEYILHSIAIGLSKFWARVTHFISKTYKKIEDKIENYFNHKHEDNVNKNTKTKSILLTTIKAYKKEIKKLNKKIEPDEMKPRNQIEDK